MKTRIINILLIPIALLLWGCSAEKDQFILEGDFSHLRQGEFYIYSIDGAFDGIDTIRIQGGEFDYTCTLHEPSILMLRYPNYSEQVILAQPGKIVKLEGDANQLKMAEVHGTRDNDEMTGFRLTNAGLKGRALQEAAADYIHSHPESITSTALFYMYFLKEPPTDKTQMIRLYQNLIAAQPDNLFLQVLESEMQALSTSLVGATVTSFEATDIEGKSVTLKDLKDKATLLHYWALWDDNRYGDHRQLSQIRNQFQGLLQMVHISLDANIQSVTGTAKSDSLMGPVICDGKAWDTPLVRQFAVGKVPYYILLSPDHHILWRGDNLTDLRLALIQYKNSKP